MPQSEDRLVTESIRITEGSNKSLQAQVLETLQFLGGGRRAMGTITFSGQPADAQIVTIGDGINDATVFEFDDDDTITAGRVQVTIGANAEATLDTLLALINSTGDATIDNDNDTFQITGEKASATVINLKNDKIGTAGTVTITENADNFAVTGMILGADVGQLDTEMTAEIVVGDIDIGAVHLLDTADAKIDPAAAYADDTAHTAADWLTPAAVVRTDTRASLVDTTADYTPLQATANGDLRTRDDDLLTEVGAKADAAAEDGSVNAKLRYIAGAVATEGDALGDGVLLQGDDGTDRTNVLVDTDGHLQTDVLSAAPTTRVEKNPVILTQAVGTPGTAEAFAGTQQVIYFEIRAGKVDGVNVGNVYIGTGAVDKDGSKQIVLFPGDTYRFSAPDGISTDLDAWFIDADNAADGITGWYIAA